MVSKKNKKKQKNTNHKNNKNKTTKIPQITTLQFQPKLELKNKPHSYNALVIRSQS